LHLPSSLSHDADVTLLSPGESGSKHRSKSVKVLLGVRLKSSYSFQEAAMVKPVEYSLPVIFQRECSSIRSVQGQVQYSVRGSSAPQSLGFSSSEQSISTTQNDPEQIIMIEGEFDSTWYEETRYIHAPVNEQGHRFIR